MMSDRKHLRCAVVHAVRSTPVGFPGSRSRPVPPSRRRPTRSMASPPLDVAPSAASQGVALLRQYRDGALKQAGNTGVTLLQEADWPNRFVIYEAWKDQAAYDANEKAAHTAELRDKLKPIAGAPYDRRDYHVISVGPAQAGGRRRHRLHAAASRRLPARHRDDPGGRKGGGRGGPQGRRQSALRRRAVGQAAAEPHDLARRLAEPQGVRRL